jgi:hypothetical protein
MYRGEPVPPAPLPPPAIAVAPVCPCPQPVPPPGVPGSYVTGTVAAEPIQPAVRVVAPPAPAVSCAIGQTCPAEAHGCSLRVVTEDGADRLEVHGAADTLMTCDQLGLKLAGHKSVKATVVRKQVALSSPALEAMADHVTLSSGDHVVLEGNAQLVVRPGEKNASQVNAGRIVLDLSGGQLKITAEMTANVKHVKTALSTHAEQLMNDWVRGLCPAGSCFPH